MKKSNIIRISKCETRDRFTMTVFYSSGRRFHYTEKDNLPDSVWQILLDKNVEYSVRYLKDSQNNVTRHEAWTPCK